MTSFGPHELVYVVEWNKAYSPILYISRRAGPTHVGPRQSHPSSCHPQQQQPDTPPHLAPGGGLSPTSDALIGHSPGGRPRRRGMASAKAVVVERMSNVKRCQTLSNRKELVIKGNSADHHTSLSSLLINI